MSIITGDSQCPKCAANGGDKTGNHLIHFDNGNKYCNRCRYKVFGDTNEEENQLTNTVEEITDNLPIGGDIKSRGLLSSFTELYGLRQEFDTNTGEASKFYAPLYETGTNELLGYQERTLPKTFRYIGNIKGKNIQFVGQDLVRDGGKFLIIVEGYLDTIAAKQMLSQNKKSWSVVGSWSTSLVQSFKANIEWLNNFDTIVLALDQDKAGRKAVESVMGLLPPNKMKMATYSEIDPCDMLLANKDTEFINSLSAAKTFIPKGIINALDVLPDFLNLKDKPSTTFPKEWAGVNEMTDGFRNGELIMYSGASGGGKQQPLYSKVLTPTGFETMGDMYVGKRIVHPKGGTSEVIAIHPQGQDRVYEVHLDTGDIVECGLEHIFHVKDESTNLYVDLSIKEILEHTEKERFKIPMLDRADMDEVKLPLHPYIIGALIADGNILSHTSGNKFISDKVEGLLPEGVSFNKSGLDSLNHIHNKGIPKEYLVGSHNQRLELLRGLMDCGGYSSERNISYSTSSLRLSKDISELVSSLGGRTYTTSQDKGSGKHVVTIKFTTLNPFSLPRKADEVSETETVQHSIVDIVKTDRFTEQQCITIDREDGLYITDGYVITHNSALMDELADHLISNVPDSRVGILKMEHNNEVGLQSVLSVHLKTNLKTRRSEFTDEELTVKWNEYFGGDRAFLIDHGFSGIGDDSGFISKLVGLIVNAGCTDIIIDHLHAVLSDSAGDNEDVDSLMYSLQRVAQLYQVTLHVVVHLRKTGSGGKSFENGAVPTMDDIKGSSSMKQVSDGIIFFSRDTQHEDPVLRRVATLTVAKNRWLGKTGEADKIIYEPDSNKYYVFDEDEHEEGVRQEEMMSTGSIRI